MPLRGTCDTRKGPVWTPAARSSTTLRPARPFTVPAPAPSTAGAPDLDAQIDRAARYGHDFSRLVVRSRAAAPAPASAPETILELPRAIQEAPAGAMALPQGGVIQCKGPLDWIKEKLGFGGSGENQRLMRSNSVHYNRNVMVDPIFGTHERELQQNRELAKEASSSTVPEKVSIAGSVLSGGISGVGKAADAVKLAGLAGGQVLGSATTALGGTVTAAGGLIDAGVNVYDLATGGRQTGDKLETISKLGSNVGKVTANTGLALQHGSQLLGGSGLSAASSAIAPAVAPAALAMGGLDIVGGGYGAYRANQRQKALGKLARKGDSGIKGMAEFAQEQQKTKRNVNLGRMVQGGLGVAGGATLLALGLSNPIGWGLLGAAGLAAGIGAGYKQYRKHQQGKRLLHDDDYRARLGLSGVNLPQRGEFDNQFAPKRVWNTMKAVDDVRGQIGHQLVEDWMYAGGGKDKLRENIGVKKEPWAFTHRPTGKEKKKRARQIARALDV